MSTRRWRLGAAVYFALQGASGVAWWALLWAFPAAGELFWYRSPGGFDGRGLLAFALPDAAGFVGLSLAVAWAAWRGAPALWSVLCLHAGAVGYATLACWNLALVTQGEAFLPALMMTPSLAAVAFWVWKLRPASGGQLP